MRTCLLIAAALLSACGEDQPPCGGPNGQRGVLSFWGNAGFGLPVATGLSTVVWLQSDQGWRDPDGDCSAVESHLDFSGAELELDAPAGVDASTAPRSDGWNISLRCRSAGTFTIGARVMAQGRARYSDSFALVCADAAELHVEMEQPFAEALLGGVVYANVTATDSRGLPLGGSGYSADGAFSVRQAAPRESFFTVALDAGATGGGRVIAGPTSAALPVTVVDAPGWTLGLAVSWNAQDASMVADAYAATADGKQLTGLDGCTWGLEAPWFCSAITYASAGNPVCVALGQQRACAQVPAH